MYIHACSFLLSTEKFQVLFQRGEASSEAIAIAIANSKAKPLADIS